MTASSHDLQAGQRVRVRRFGASHCEEVTLLRPVRNSAWIAVDDNGKREMITQVTIERGRRATRIPA